MLRLPFISHQFGITFGAVLNIFRWAGFWVSLCEIYSNDLWDDFPAFFHINFIAFPHIQFLNLVCIVQRSSFYNGTPELDGIKIGNRSNGTRASYLVGDLVLI